MSEPTRRPIPGLPGYEADDIGNVWSVGSNWRGYGARRLHAFPDSHGYLKVRVMRNGQRVPQAVHRLVNLAFHGKPPTHEYETRHLDGDRRNNRPENLAWGTCRENAADREQHGRTARGERNGSARLTPEDVRIIRAFLADGTSPALIATWFGVDSQTIRLVERRETWAHL